MIPIADIFLVKVVHALTRAEREHCDLITADQRLSNVLKADFPFLTDPATLP